MRAIAQWSVTRASRRGCVSVGGVAVCVVHGTSVRTAEIEIFRDDRFGTGGRDDTRYDPCSGTCRRVRFGERVLSD